MRVLQQFRQPGGGSPQTLVTRLNLVTRTLLFFSVSLKGRSLLPEEVRLRTEVLILKN
ncbi:hypothetical protein ACF3DV_05030 [Chlorogloeopsis fritschii PCC 9212]|uniref:hypothetical protein n=1 Tax=Chlorogloeopsis fritschii TaxID=1124 RepID=UPI0002DCE9E4|nr:hypothetical protein [Chlorogloeopsis fritschii]MBF2008706.1 hypothetical protein [Chlorogloeopsis fritschii C42_A2020_084]